jgi:xanthine dehydrogenase molybdenum-binding subunit
LTVTGETTMQKRNEPPQYKVIGTRPVRHDGVDKVTGRAVYGADVQMPGLIHGRILRSPIAHGRIESIDTSAAEKLSGVLAVVTSKDFPNLENKIADLGEGAVNLAHLGANCLAQGKVLYKGHAVAAVAAASPHIAKEALALIKVEYKPLPVVTWVLDAMKPDAPLLHPICAPTRWASAAISRVTSPRICISKWATSIRPSPRLTW